MKKLTRILLAGAALLATVGIARGMIVKYNSYLVNEAGLAYSKNYVLPLNTLGVDNISFVSTVSSVTFSNQTFTDGSLSTGTITVTTTTGLGAIQASDILTVVSTVATTSNIAITLNGVTIDNLATPFEDATTTATAINLLNLFTRSVPAVTLSTGGASTLSATSTVAGSFGNNMIWSTNVSTGVISFIRYLSSGPTSSSSNFSGGADAARLSVNGFNIPFTITTNTVFGASTTATSIAASIFASSATIGVVATAIGPVVGATSTVVGLNTNYILTSSTQSALTIGGTTATVAGFPGASTGQMTGGTNSAYTLVLGSSTVISFSTQNFTLGLPVLYTTTSGQAITGLTSGVTYYVMPNTNNSIQLAYTSTGALANLPVIMTSSISKTTADVFTLAPLAISGTPTLQWQVSNDALTWYPLTSTVYNVTVSSVSYNTFNSTGTVNTWDFGPIDYEFIRAAVVGPTQGAINIKVSGNGKGTIQ